MTASRLVRLSVCIAVAIVPSACGPAPVTLLDASYHGRPKRILVGDDLSKEFGSWELTQFRTKIVEELQRCDVVAETVDLEGAPSAGDKDRKIDALLTLRTASVTYLNSVTQWMIIDASYLQIPSSKAIWTLKFRHVPSTLPFTKDSHGRNLAKEIVERLAHEGVLKGCPKLPPATTQNSSSTAPN
ncbi:MAG: hypothetical protein WAP03_30475 [Methylorubrum rhodinum]|uniref:hypothetical protein n=1 Tax=Methylorubrum rhodinum TaxID=29428 RepID=UPI003BAE7D9C